VNPFGCAALPWRQACDINRSCTTGKRGKILIFIAPGNEFRNGTPPRAGRKVQRRSDCRQLRMPARRQPNRISAPEIMPARQPLHTKKGGPKAA
jgi:hypothetical protein